MAKKRKKEYAEYGTYISNIMTDVVDFVASNSASGKLHPKDMLLLDRLAELLDLYQAVKEYNMEHGIVAIDRFGNPKKSEYIKAQLEIFNQIFKIAGVYGLTLKDERKIQAAETDGESLVDLLTELNEN